MDSANAEDCAGQTQEKPRLAGRPVDCEKGAGRVFQSGEVVKGRIWRNPSPVISSADLA